MFYKTRDCPRSLIERRPEYTLNDISYARKGYPQELIPKGLFQGFIPGPDRCYDHLMEQFTSNRAIEARLPLVEIPSKPMWLRFAVLRYRHCRSCVEGDTLSRID